MGKIVKFCASCEESFAEKFSFCPNCASELSPFEMKPVEETPVAEEFVDEVPTVDLSKEYQTMDLEDKKPIIAESETVEDIEEQAVFEPVHFSDESVDEGANSAEMISEDVMEIEVEEPTVKDEVFAADEIPADSNESEEAMATMFTADKPQESDDANYTEVANITDDTYHVTVVSERSGKIRNGLLLSAFAVVIFGFVGLMLYSLFANLDDVASLNEDDRLLALLDGDPMQSKDEEKEDENKEDDGGGGGGGKQNPKPVSKGERPNQIDRLPPPPQVLPRLKDPSMPRPNFTKGPPTNRERKGPIGDEASLSRDPSSGPGKGDGVGNRGDGQGLGDGLGPGEGPGSNGGRGGGNNGGAGPGGGPGGNGGRNRPRAKKTKPPPPPKPKKVVRPTKIQILSKPKPGYTDAARQNNVRGVVRVRVVFLASGRIGGVKVVKGLPHGLTQKALAAARQIRFKPPTRNGVPHSISKTVVFNFNIY